MDEKLMVELRVKIIEYVDGSQPGWVRCAFADAFGVVWSVIDKVPIFTTEYLDEQSDYPQEGIINCVILFEKNAEIVRIDTSRPFSIEAEDGEHEFDVFKSQLVGYENKVGI